MPLGYCGSRGLTVERLYPWQHPSARRPPSAVECKECLSAKDMYRVSVKREEGRRSHQLSLPTLALISYLDSIEHGQCRDNAIGGRANGGVAALLHGAGRRPLQKTRQGKLRSTFGRRRSHQHLLVVRFDADDAGNRARPLLTILLPFWYRSM